MSIYPDFEAMRFVRWASCEIDYLRANWSKDRALDIALALKRSEGAVLNKACQIGISDCRKRYRHALREMKIRRQEIIARYHAEVSIEELVDMCAAGRSTIVRDLKEMGLSTAPVRRPAERKQAVLQWYGKGKSARQLAEELGCTRDAIIGTARDLGLCKPKNGVKNAG